MITRHNFAICQADIDGRRSKLGADALREICRDLLQLEKTLRQPC